MKKIISLTACLAIYMVSFAQAPQKFNYQGVARDSAGNILSNKLLSFRLSILQTNVAGASVYTETQTATSDTRGVFSLEVGGGTLVSGAFNSINWGGDAFYLKTEMDNTGGSNYKTMGTTQMLSVPYAQFANKAGNVPTDGDTSATNELQALSVSNDTIFLTNGGFVKIPPASILNNVFNDWRFPDSPFDSSVKLIGQSVNNTIIYTVPSGKRLYIFSVRFTNNSQAFRIDANTIIKAGSLGYESWQGRSGSQLRSGALDNPIIVDSGQVIDSDIPSTVSFVGYLINNPSNNITLITKSISSTITYTVPNGKMFVLLNAFCSDTYSLEVIPAGGSSIDIGKNLNYPSSGGFWVIEIPMFFYPGDKIKSTAVSTNDSAIHGYLISF